MAGLARPIAYRPAQLGRLPSPKPSGSSLTEADQDRVIDGVLGFARR